MAAPHTPTPVKIWSRCRATAGVPPCASSWRSSRGWERDPPSAANSPLRAFLNGRIDLAQAEAVASLVTARTPASVRQALGQLDGRLSGEIAAVRALLFDPLARIEAVLDFAEEDVPLPAPCDATRRPRRRPQPASKRSLAGARARAARPRGSTGGTGGPPECRQVELAQCATRSRPRHRHADSWHHPRCLDGVPQSGRRPRHPR